MNYTVNGDGVNLASRLGALSKIYGVLMVVSAGTRAAAPKFIYRELDLVRVSGTANSVAIFQPLGRTQGKIGRARRPGVGGLS